MNNILETIKFKALNEKELTESENQALESLLMTNESKVVSVVKNKRFDGSRTLKSSLNKLLKNIKPSKVTDLVVVEKNQTKALLKTELNEKEKLKQDLRRLERKVREPAIMDKDDRIANGRDVEERFIDLFTDLRKKLHFPLGCDADATSWFDDLKDEFCIEAVESLFKSFKKGIKGPVERKNYYTFPSFPEVYENLPSAQSYLHCYEIAIIRKKLERLCKN